MKVQVKDLVPNPYRKMKKYPIDRTKVEALKTSIKETDFWDNILARKVGDEYQIAYGHHRLTAIKELGIKEVDIPVKNIDDATMLKIMANENMEDWKLTVSVINETVSAAKEFIEKELSKNWIELDKNFRLIFNDQHGFSEAKTKGIGRNIIARFLGGNWQEHIIQQALQAINGFKDQPIDKEAVEVFKEQRHAKSFMEEVRSKKIPKEQQMEYAKKVIEKAKDKEDLTSHDIREAVYDVYTEKNKNKPHMEKVDQSRELDNYEKLLNVFSQMTRLAKDAKELKKKISEKHYSRLDQAASNIIESLKEFRTIARVIK